MAEFIRNGGTPEFGGPLRRVPAPRTFPVYLRLPNAMIVHASRATTEGDIVLRRRQTGHEGFVID